MRLLGLLSLVFLVAGGGAGAWWFLAGPSGGTGEAIAKPVAPAAVAATPAFIDLDPLVLPVLGEGQVLRILTLQVTLEVAGAEDRTLLEQAAPKVRDAMLSEMHALLSLRHVQKRGADLGLFRRHLHAASERAVGKEIVNGVLIREIGNRPAAHG